MLPALPIWSKSRPTLISSGRRTGQDDPPGTTAFSFLAALDAAGYLIDGVVKRVAHGEFVDAGALDMAGDAEKARASVAFGAELCVGLTAHEQDVRGCSDGLRVVDDRGSAVQADNGGERRLDAGNAALALKRLP